MDIYNRNCSTTDFNAYLIEVFVFKDKERKQVEIVNNNHVINKYDPNYREEKNKIFSYRVVNLANEKYVVTLLVSSITMNFDAKSEFSLNSPQQTKCGKNIGLFCVYPSTLIPRNSSNSLDYKQE
ncbi:hypothetical protein FDC58_03755 [Clostridium botulinum]|nr:hypothetical protein [Clostridium botulinum]NFP28412.1 hypothetical protein [Clostridium botulinum]